jgi:hypothetical protein
MERKEPTPVEMVNAAGHEDFDGAMRVETVWATDDRFRDWLVSVRKASPTAEEKDPG